MLKGTLVAAVFGIAFASGAYATTMNYEYEGKWGSYGSGDGQFDRSEGICRAPNGNVYVADMNNNRIQYFTADGSFLGKWGTKGTGQGQFSMPWDIGINSAGTVYVVDYGNNRIQYFTATGVYRGGWGSYGSAQGQFNGPAGIGVAPNGNVYVAEIFNSRIQYFTSSGSFLGMWGSPGSGEGQFNKPLGVSVAPDGVVYVSESNGRRVQYFTPSGSFLGKFSPEPSIYCDDVEVTADYRVYVAGGYVTEIYVKIFTKTGSELGKVGKYGVGDGEFTALTGVTVEPSTSRIYASDYDMNRVQYFKFINPGVEPVSLGRVKVLFR
jgi:tripartite motif-containing protein 71